MKQMTEVGQKRPLLKYAISKLNPDIFSHPVWVRFGRQDVKHPIATANELLSAAEILEPNDPVSTSQILFACAFYQNIAGKNNLALATLGRILELAGQARFTAGVFWAHWGSCAVCFQMEKYDQAVSHLGNLQMKLSDQKEWVLADFVDVIKQSLEFPLTESTLRYPKLSMDSPYDDLMYFTFLWLQQWGFEIDFPNPNRQRWWAYWHSLNNMLNGNSKLSGEKNIKFLMKREFPFFRLFTQNSPYLQKTDREIVSQPSSNDPSSLFVGTSQPGKTEVSAHPSPQDMQPASKNLGMPDKTIRAIPLTIQMLGQFSIAIQDSQIKLPASRGLALLKYLLLRHKQDTPREVLMDIFWPDADPEAARNNLNVAIYGLRQVLHSVTDVPIIRFEDGAYGLAPNLEIWLDVEEYDRCIKGGQRLETQNPHQITAAVTEYEIAVNLYRGDFLIDTPYESWTVLERERLRISYIDTVDHLSQIYFTQERYAACVGLCQLILTRDACREDVHCRLMQCFSRLGQGPLALRQYQICKQALRTELDVEPEPVTDQLAERIRRHERV